MNEETQYDGISYMSLLKSCGSRNDLLVTKETEITPEIVSEYIGIWKSRQPLYAYFRNMYRGNHPIYWEKSKPSYKPDNRVVVNFAKYIVDTLNSFFLGIPLKITTDDEYATQFLAKFAQINNLEDKCNELSKACSIYGHAYILIYTDEHSNFRIEVLTPEHCCVVYDDTLSHDPVFAFTVLEGEDGNQYGSYCTKDEIVYFSGESALAVTGREQNRMNAVSIVEFVENEEKQCVFENVASQIEALDKVISLALNDYDSIADSYLKILGALVSEDDIKAIRESRVVNIASDETDKIEVDFLSKPDSNTSAENLIEWLKEFIFQTSMVANISDENFGSSSGISLKYKLQPMSNLAKYKAVKFKAGLNRMFEIICECPNYFGDKNAWLDFNYKFTQNIPNNELEETQIAQNLSGIVSQKTQLSVLSVVPDVDEEIERLDKEEKEFDDYDFSHVHESVTIDERKQ